MMGVTTRRIRWSAVLAATTIVFSVFSSVPGAAAAAVVLPVAEVNPFIGLTEGTFIVTLDDPSIAAYRGGTGSLRATSTEGESKLDTKSSRSVVYRAHLERRQSKVIEGMEEALGRAVMVEYQYFNAINALAVHLTADEAALVLQVAGVSGVVPDRVYKLNTDESPDYIGATSVWNGDIRSEMEARGEGMIIGIVDSGINPGNRSFADVSADGYDHENPWGAGQYVGVCDTENPEVSTFACNDKLIGARGFGMIGSPVDPTAPFDDQGHGSHVASIAAGGYTELTDAAGNTRTIRGVAPRANIVAYDACFMRDCPSTRVVAAIDMAIGDGVDVLNISLGKLGVEPDPWEATSMSMAALGALEAGIFVAHSAGNDGPLAGTLGSPIGPWMTHVGATQQNSDRVRVDSSRGPHTTLDIVGPNIVAPGSHILGAGLDEDGANSWFHAGGTSQASPHVAGTAALLFELNNDWSPDQVRSAMMLTAVQPERDSAGNPLYSPFDVGAGRIDAKAAANAGLIMSETGANYRQSNPGTGGDVRTLNLPSMANSNCAVTCSWIRTVTATTTGQWTATASGDELFRLTVDPESFDLSPGESQSLTVTAEAIGGTGDEYAFGLVELEAVGSDIPKSVMQVAVKPVAAPMPDLSLTKTIGSVTPGTFNDVYGVQVTFDYVVSNTGDVNVNNLWLVDDVIDQFPDAEVSGFAATVTEGGDLAAANEGWDGTADSNMLDDGQTLLGGTSVTVTGSFIVAPATRRVYPGSAATVSASVQDGGPVEAMSAVLPVTLPPRQLIGLAQSADVLNNGDGTYGVTYVYVVENFGNVPLTDLQLFDDVVATFGDHEVTDFAVGSGTWEAYEALNGDEAWDGGIDSNIVAPGQVLEPGESGVVVATFTVTPASPHVNPLTYDTTALVSGTYESVTVDDVSTDGTDPDPDEDGDPTNNRDATVVTFVEGGAISVTKSLGSVAGSVGGADEVTFDYVVVNSGDVNVNNLSLVDDVNGQFLGAEVSGFAATVTDGGDVVTVNEGWDGTVGSNLFSDGQSLLRGTSVTVRGSFMVTPGTRLEYPGGSATVSGSTPSGATVGNMSDVVPVDLRQPVIGLAKEATVVNNGDGTYEVSYDFVVENFGNVDLTDVAIYDRARGFGDTTGFTVRDGSLGGNEEWIGDRGTSILEANQVLSVGESGTVSVSFTVTTLTDLDPRESPAEATGNWAGGEVSDEATDGRDPDPDGDGDPTNNQDVTVVEFVEAEAISVMKTLAPVGENVAGAYEVTFNYVVSNTGDVNVNNLRLVDDVIGQFSGAEVSGFAATVTDGTDLVTVNEDWDGTTVSNVFSDGQSLLRDTSVTVRGSFMVTPGTSLEYPGGLAIVSGSTPSGVPVEDMSDVVPVTFPALPVIGLAKEATASHIGEGAYGVTYNYVVENLGNVPLVDLTLIDDVVGTFRDSAVTEFSVITDAQSANGLRGNPAWDGVSGSNILAVGQDLEPGEAGTVSVSFTVTPARPHEVPLTYNTTAIVTGTHELVTVDDDSTDGSDPDPDDDGDPLDDRVATVVAFEDPSAGITVVPRATVVDDDGQGTYVVTFEYSLMNSGDMDVTSLELYGDVVGGFGDGTVTTTGVTSADFVVNEDWTGEVNSNMLAGDQLLAAGGEAAVTVTVTVAPGTNRGPYESAGIRVTGRVANRVTFDTGGSTTVTFPPWRVIGLAQDVDVVNNGDGTYEVTYDYVVENFGNVPLASLELVDDLFDTFRNQEVTAFTAAAGTREGYEALSGNDAWDGMGSNILADDQVLQPGESGAVSASFTVTPTSPHDNPLTYNTTAFVSGTHDLVAVSDEGTDGTVPDSDGDGDPTNNQDLTVVEFVESEEIGVVKTLGPVGENVAGAYEVTFDYVVSNTGDVNVNNLRLVDDVIGQFPGAEVSGFAATVTDGTDLVTVNEDWDGTTGSNMFSDGQSLLRDTSVTVRGSFMVTPGTRQMYSGSAATVSGSTPSGVPVEDMSDVVPVTFPALPVIGLAKEATASHSGEGTYAVTYNYVVENLGNVPLTDLQLFDDVVGTFGDSAVTGPLAITDAQGVNGLRGNPAWDGVSGSNILAVGQDLAPGESGTVSVSFTVTPTSPHDVPLTYDTTAIVTGTHELVTVEDVSTDGSDPDPDDDGDPLDDRVATVVAFEDPSAGISVLPRATVVDDDGQGTYVVTFEYSLMNSGDMDVTSLELYGDVVGGFGDGTVTTTGVTSADFVVNEDWTGEVNSNMLAGDQLLAAGGEAAVTVTVTVAPGTNRGPYESAGIRVTGRVANRVTFDTGGSTTVTFPPWRVIGLAQDVDVVNNGDGTYEVTYDYVVENFGNVPLASLELVDDLFDTFRNQEVTAFTAAAGTREGYEALSGNDAWDGMGSNILADDQVLQPGESGAVSASFTVTPTSPHDNPLTYNTTAFVSGTHDLVAVSDEGTDGTVPDSDGDGDPTNNQDLTVVEFVESEEIGVVKTLGPVGENVAGAYEVTFDYVVSNTGDVNVNNLRLVDDVIGQFPGAEVSGFAATVTDGGDVVAVNEGWDGTTGSNMFSDGQSLLRGTSVTVRGSFMVTPGTSLEYPGGLATVSGSTPSGAPVEDMSDVVPVDLTQPVIGLAKEATVVNNGDGQYVVAYNYVVENLGNVPLTDLQLFDDVVEIFGTTATGFAAGTGTREGYEALNGNDAWDGTGSNILAVGQDLAPGESGVVSVSFTVTPTSPHDVPLTYDTTATVTGTHELMTVEDVSTDGTDPDPDGDGDPANNGDVTVVTFNEDGAIGVTKTLGSVGENVAGAYEVTFDYVVVNSGDVNVNDLWLVDDVIGQFPGAEVSGFVATVTEGGDLVTVDEGWDGTAGSNVFSVGQSLLRGTSVTVRGSFMVTPGTSLEYPGGLATVSGSTPSGAPVEDMSDSVGVSFESFDLELVVTDSGDAYSGGMLSYVFSTTNLGPGVAYGPLVLVVDVPVGLSIVSASGSDDSCVIEGQVVTCTRVGDLGVGASSDVTVLTTVVAADGVSLAVSGSVMSQGGVAEGSVTNNADTASRVVGALPTTGFVFSWLWLLGALVMVVGSGVVWSANRRREDALL